MSISKLYSPFYGNCLSRERKCNPLIMLSMCVGIQHKTDCSEQCYAWRNNKANISFKSKL